MFTSKYAKNVKKALLKRQNVRRDKDTWPKLRILQLLSSYHQQTSAIQHRMVSKVIGNVEFRIFFFALSIQKKWMALFLHRAATGPCPITLSDISLAYNQAMRFKVAARQCPKQS
jgi:hypothetical protein